MTDKRGDSGVGHPISGAWRVWDKDKSYGETFRRRANQELPEMESAKATARKLKEEIRPDESILDVGCGVGHYLPSFKRLLDVPFYYTGIDSTECYIERAREAFANQNNVRFDVGDIYNLPYADEVYDVVVCCNLLLHLPTIEQALHELCRVARRFVLIRTLVGERSFIVKEVRKCPSGAGHSNDCCDEFDEFGEPKSFCYYNIYSFDYLKRLLTRCHGLRSFEILPDLDFAAEKICSDESMALLPSCKTKIVEDIQLMGYLVLPWSFIMIIKETKA
jgi:ubiquinone/menaquinone biosynthesis C-methylase UbiE